jgi:hypothetical protein
MPSLRREGDGDFSLITEYLMHEIHRSFRSLVLPFVPIAASQGQQEQYIKESIKNLCLYVPAFANDHVARKLDWN